MEPVGNCRHCLNNEKMSEYGLTLILGMHCGQYQWRFLPPNRFLRMIRGPTSSSCAREVKGHFDVEESEGGHLLAKYSVVILG